MAMLPTRARRAALAALLVLACACGAAHAQVAAPAGSTPATPAPQAAPPPAAPKSRFEGVADVAPELAPTDADAELSERTAARLRNIEGLQNVDVTVAAGVARLDGTVVDVRDRALATQVAKQQPGIVAVENHLQLSTNLGDRFQAALRLVIAKLIRLLAATPLLALALTIVLLAWWLGRALSRRIHLRRLQRRNPYIDALFGRLLRWLVLVAGLLLALDLLDASTLVGAVLGSAGVVGLALGFAFKDIAENYVAGILLGLRRPFAPDDHLLIDKYEGKVVALTSRVTLLMTLDGNHLSLPNALVFKSVVLNYTVNPQRRFEFSLPIDPAESIRESRTLALAAIAEIDGVLAEPAPSWSADGFAANGIELRFFGWVDQRRSDPAKVRSEALRAAKTVFGRAGIHGPGAVRYLAEPLPDSDAEQCGDTSVNHDIDHQLAAAQRATDAANLLEDAPAATPAASAERGTP